MKATVLLLAVLGCSDNNQVNITVPVGSQGGTVTGPGGSSVTVPSGALSTNTNITLSKVDAPAPPGTVLVGPAFDFGPDGTTFATPATITLNFDSTLLPAGRSAADIVIYTAPRGTTNYTALATTVTGNTAITTTSHFTVYLPAAPVANAVADLSVSPIGSPDFATPNCSPICTTGSSGCSCTETCSSSVITMTCASNGSSGYNCVCKANGQTLTNTPLVLDCTSSSELTSAFLQCAG